MHENHQTHTVLPALHTVTMIAEPTIMSKRIWWAVLLDRSGLRDWLGWVSIKCIQTVLSCPSLHKKLSGKFSMITTATRVFITGAACPNENKNLC